MSMESTVKGYEVHARKRGRKIFFRIWDGEKNRYATEEMKDEQQVAKKLIALEVDRAQQRVEHVRQKVSAEAAERIQNAREDGFESPFCTSGELNDPWKKEGKPIVRGI